MRKRTVLVVSHACIRQVNRAVYRELSQSVQVIALVVPSSIILASGQVLQCEPQLDDDPDIVPLKLIGRNPRTYFFSGLASVLKKRAPDIVILENDPASRLGITISLWCRKFGSKLVCQSYENMGRGIRATLANRGWLGIPRNLVIHGTNQWMARRVHALIVVNGDGERIFRAYNYPGIVRMPLGYDPKVFFLNEELRVKFRKTLDVSDDTVLIAYFGRMVHQKGVHILIEALSELKSLPWKLLLDDAFDGQERYASNLRGMLANLGFAERVIWFKANHTEIANYMRAADIAVAPSLNTRHFKEQYGRTVQESMACGCICLVSDSGHLPDLVGSPSYVFPAGQSAELSKLLADWIVDKSKRDSDRAILASRAVSMLTTLRQSEQLKHVINLLSASFEK